MYPPPQVARPSTQKKCSIPLKRGEQGSFWLKWAAKRPMRATGDAWTGLETAVPPSGGHQANRHRRHPHGPPHPRAKPRIPRPKHPRHAPCATQKRQNILPLPTDTPRRSARMVQACVPSGGTMAIGIRRNNPGHAGARRAHAHATHSGTLPSRHQAFRVAQEGSWRMARVGGPSLQRHSHAHRIPSGQARTRTTPIMSGAIGAPATFQQRKTSRPCRHDTAHHAS